MTGHAAIDLPPGRGRRLRPTPVSVQDVPDLVRGAVTQRSAIVHLPVADVAGQLLACNLRASEALPAFDQSAVDGYAFAGAPIADVAPLAGTVRAGQAAPPLPPGSACRVMTGAMLPAGTDRVAPQERCRVTACGIGARHIEPGANVRRCGEDVQEGDLLVAGGTRLDPRHIALLAATGHSIIPCRDRLRVALVATGDEVVRGTPDRSRGQVRDSNTPMLAALLSTARDFDVAEFSCADGAANLTSLLERLIDHADLIITTGGMSSGLEDHVRRAWLDIDGRFIFEAVAMKPGKPVGLACVGSAVLLGLPGNSFAALVAFLVVGREVIARLRGRASPRDDLPARAGFALDRRPGRTEFFPARVLGLDPDGTPVIDRLGKGGSARLAPLVAADGLGRIECDRVQVSVGDAVGFLPFEAALRL